jgi:hypothetical protein
MWEIDLRDRRKDVKAMSCAEMKELMVNYHEMLQSDNNRVLVDEHVKQCKECNKELSFWQESFQLIHSANLIETSDLPAQISINKSVMDRIYAQERWRLPIVERIYAIPYALRIRIMTIFATLLTLFIGGFTYTIILPQQIASINTSITEVMGVKTLGSNESSEFNVVMEEGLPVASIGDPIVLALPLVDSYPNYLLVISMFGLIGTLLLLNWFMRIRF